jgi:hypothetical protein
MYTNEYPDDWDEHLNYCIWAYRTSTNDTTKHSPFYLLYGREALFPLDAMLESEEKYRSSEEYVAEIIQKLKIAKELVIKSALRIKQKRDDNNAQKNRLKSFNVGEYVMLFQPASKKGISSKLLHKWKGPFTIIAQTSPVNYVIKNVANGRKTDHVHVSRLKSCYRREVAADGLTFTSEAKVDVPAAKTSRKKKNDLNPADEEMGTAFEVSKIVGKGWDEVSPGKWVPRYRVRWKGYGEADDTWESLDNLTGLEGLIETYDALHTDDEETYTDTTAEVNLVAIQLF